MGKTWNPNAKNTSEDECASCGHTRRLHYKSGCTYSESGINQCMCPKFVIEVDSE